VSDPASGGQPPAHRPATRVVHAGLPVAGAGAPFLPGPTFAAPFHAPGNPEDSQYTYGRFDNPTWRAYESAIGELEGGAAVLFPSGMAATSALLACVLSRGDRVVMPADSYYTTRLIAAEHFAGHGIDVVTAPTRGDAQRELLDGATLLWLESPTNPGLDVCDITALAQAARERGVLVAVDNTTATVLGQRPLALGADFSVASDTKAMTGHADLVLGHVACRDDAWMERLRTWRTRMGVIPGPMEVWLAHRSLPTLDIRLERQCANAMAVATFLASHAKVANVRYPGLAADPSHETAARQMSRFGGVVAFTLEDRAAVERFFAASSLVFEATSFGGVHTSAERRARWGGDLVPEGYVRMSLGVEDADDLVADISHALESV
jgi:cystathionine gamma-lyase